MVSNQQMINLVNKMKRGGELSMGDAQPNTLEMTNSEKAQRFFAGLHSSSYHLVSAAEDPSRTHELQSTNQFANTQVLGSTALVHNNEEAT